MIYISTTQVYNEHETPQESSEAFISAIYFIVNPGCAKSLLFDVQEGYTPCWFE